jgi:hypothetical protein
MLYILKGVTWHHNRLQNISIAVKGYFLRRVPREWTALIIVNITAIPYLEALLRFPECNQWSTF